jgi:membrane protein implicated in regulation of membrane protease activity
MTLDAIGGAAAAWVVAALALGIAELVVPGVFLIFLAIAAGVTAAIVYALPEVPAAAQIASFAVWSAATVLIGRRWYRDYPVAGDDGALNDRGGRLVGTIVTVTTPLADGRGRVSIGDGSWLAAGPDMAAGTRARVVAIDGGMVVIEPVDSSDPAGLPDLR